MQQVIQKVQLSWFVGGWEFMLMMVRWRPNNEHTRMQSLLDVALGGK